MTMVIGWPCLRSQQCHRRISLLKQPGKFWGNGCNKIPFNISMNSVNIMKIIDSDCAYAGFGISVKAKEASEDTFSVK